MRIERSKPLKDSLSEEHRDTINKALEIQNILLYEKPNDKRFNKNNTSYLLEYIQILNYIEDNKDYSDKIAIMRINHLYNKIFKNRRY